MTTVKYYRVDHVGGWRLQREELTAAEFWRAVNYGKGGAYASAKIGGVRRFVLLYTKDSTIEKASDILELERKGVLKWTTATLNWDRWEEQNGKTSTGTSTGKNSAKKSKNEGLKSGSMYQKSLF